MEIHRNDAEQILYKTEVFFFFFYRYNNFDTFFLDATIINIDVMYRSITSRWSYTGARH